MQKIPRVKLHPQTIKYLKLGHPWVTEDSYTKKFPDSKFIVGINDRAQDEALFLQDRNHKNIKARLWSIVAPFDIDQDFFKKQLIERIKTSIQKRKWMFENEKTIHGRENFYVIFGEADFLPGLFVQKLKDHYVIGSYANFWDEHIKETIFETLVTELKPSHDITPIIWYQERNKTQEKKVINLSDPRVEQVEFTLTEFGSKLIIRINNYYDLGVYTDMSAIRPQIFKKLSEVNSNAQKSALNLFSYTGAYSLYFLKNNFKEVVSVDLSKKYLDWLEENIKLNPDFTESSHQSICAPVGKTLKDLVNNQKFFDLIISDPPSASSDGSKMSSSYKFYDEDLESMLKLLNSNGILVAFLNTHTITRKKFEDKIQTLLKQKNLDSNFQIIKRVSLCDDCPSLKGFFEGDYLKGVLIQKIK